MCKSITPVIATMGRIKLDDDQIMNYTIAQIIIHENYTSSEKINDIALIRLEEPVQFTDTIRPACLYLKEDNPKILTITGWGINDTTSNSLHPYDICHLFFVTNFLPRYRTEGIFELSNKQKNYNEN